MRRRIIGLVICLILLSSIVLGCLEDPDDGVKDKDKDKPNQIPNADAGDDVKALSMTEIQFNGTNSTDADGTIVSYYWEFGDHTNPDKDTSNIANPTYTYNSPGTYVAKLTVTDDDKANSTDTINITIDNRKPMVDIGSDISGSTYEIIDFVITAFDPDGFLRSFEWDFNGDGTIDWHSSIMIPTTHFYTKAGNFKAKLTVTDDYNEKIVKEKSVTITEPQNIPPIADAGLNQTVHTGNVLLKGTGFDGDGAVVKYEWDYDGDGKFDWSSSSTGIAEYDYDLEGDYLAKFQVTDNKGITATDIVKITVNDSHNVNNVSSMVFLNWLTGLDYLIQLNTIVDTAPLKIVITDVILGVSEEFSGAKIITIDPTKYTVSSMLIPAPMHSIDVQVFYNDTLIGARVLDIRDENHELIGPGFDYKAVYDWNHLMEEQGRGGMEQVILESVGNTNVEHNGNLYYYSVQGTGEYFTKDESDAGVIEVTINCKKLWINLTIMNTTIIKKQISVHGKGEMTNTLKDGSVFDFNIKNAHLGIENNILINSYIYGTGTFSSRTIDTNSGNIIPISGNATFTTELLGFGMHKNLKGDEYPCGIEYSKLTMDGMTVIPDSSDNFPIKSTFINTTWNVDPDSFSNNNIYYEFSSENIIANVELIDSGSGSPSNSPVIKEPTVHISDALSLHLPRPRSFIAGDMMAYASDSGVILQLIIQPGLGTKIKNEVYETVVLNGTISGTAEGKFTIETISSGKYIGLAIHTIEDYKWNGERLVADISLKSIQDK